MAIYDVDPAYGARFADFVNQRERTPFTAMPFSSLVKLKEFAENHLVEILLIDRAALREVEGIRARQIITLADGEVVELAEECPVVYKYQSGDSIMREVMACYCKQPVENGAALLGAKASVIGVYSPVNRCLKTSFALTMGQLLARNERVLYINLEEYSGFSRLIAAQYEQDLSDVLYLYRQGAYNWLKLKSIVYSWGGMDYIPPVRYAEDLNQVTPEDMALLLDRVARESGYEKLLVDVGQMGKGALPILENCDVVYMPVKDDCISAAKVEEFEEYVEAAGSTLLRERIHKLKLPYHNSFGRRDTYMEQLLWGELGDYVRQLLRGGRGTGGE